MSSSLADDAADVSMPDADDNDSDACSFENYGVCEAQGMRPTMEDTYIILPDCGDTGFAFFGLYDGHGSAEVAHMARAALHNTIAREIQEAERVVNIVETNDAAAAADGGDDDDAIKKKKNKKKKRDSKHSRVAAAMRAGILTFDNVITRGSEEFRDAAKDAGCTAVCAMLKGADLYCANVGDAEAVLYTESKRRPDTFVPDKLTQIHRPYVENEKRRITTAGGFVALRRVGGVLAISRALGDGAFKTPLTTGDQVTAEPYITHRTVDDKRVSVLVIACDGLWDVLSAEDVAELIATYRYSCVGASDAARMLVQAALDKNTTDNVTCIVAYLGKQHR